MVLALRWTRRCLRSTRSWSRWTGPRSPPVQQAAPTPNRDAVLEMLGRFTEDLSALQKSIRYGDGEALEALFTRTRHIRREVIDAGQADPDEAPEI